MKSTQLEVDIYTCNSITKWFQSNPWLHVTVWLLCCRYSVVNIQPIRVSRLDLLPHNTVKCYQLTSYDSTQVTVVSTMPCFWSVWLIPLPFYFKLTVFMVCLLFDYKFTSRPSHFAEDIAWESLSLARWRPRLVQEESPPFLDLSIWQTGT